MEIIELFYATLVTTGFVLAIAGIALLFCTAYKLVQDCRESKKKIAANKPTALRKFSYDNRTSKQIHLDEIEESIS